MRVTKSCFSLPSLISLPSLVSALIGVSLTGLTALSHQMIAVEVPFNRAYPTEATVVPLAEKGRLQQYLDQFGVIRLEPGDYSHGNNITLHLRSGHRLYGLSNNLPPTVIAPGSEGVVLSSVHTTLTFPPSDLPTRRNLFTRVTYSHVIVNGATLEDNLFLNASYQSWKVDTTTSGRLRNNRIIKFLSHGGNPAIAWKSSADRRSGGNVFLWINLLDPQGRAMDVSGLSDLSLLFLDCEAYSGNVDAGIRVRDTGDLTIVGSGGLLNHGRTLDVEPDRLYMQGHQMGAIVPPTVLVGKKTASAIMVDSGSTQSVSDERVKTKDDLRLQIFSGDPFDKSVILNGAPLAEQPTALQAKEITRMVCDSSAGKPWERPLFESPPDPAGPKWRVGLEGKPSSSDLLQDQLDKKGMVLLGPGTYYLDKPLKLGKGKGLIGAGMDRTVLIAKSAEIDLIVSDGTAEMVLCDITLQGGRNGIYHRWTAGPKLQFTDVTLSHVTIRSMADSGIKYENIYGWDNNFIDYVAIVDCAHGFRQVADHFGSDNDPVLCYMDKNLFYQCQFINCGKALELKSYRNSANNAWVNCLFKNSQVHAAKLENHSLTMFANCDFIDNNGAPTVSAGGRVYLLSCQFESNTAKATDFIDCYALTAEGCTFRRSEASATVLQSGKPVWIAASAHPDNQRSFDARNCYLTNCTFAVPVGAIRNAVIFNSSFAFDKALNAKASIMIAGKTTAILPGVPDPQPKFLRGSQFPSLLSSGYQPPTSKRKSP